MAKPKQAGSGISFHFGFIYFNDLWGSGRFPIDDLGGKKSIAQFEKLSEVEGFGHGSSVDELSVLEILMLFELLFLFSG